MKRQKARRIALLIMFLTFPITLNYFSPYLMSGTSSHTIFSC
ncbi:MAG: hypothetical protein NUW23_15450 [Firmicutes bacterium]|nr:hypothetical protein [Bacillota bacterium]